MLFRSIEKGDQHYMYRILRSIKNRFGSTAELGIYEMRQDGLRQVSNPSELLLSRYFKTYMGINIVQYIRSMRIFYAKSLLQSSDMSIAEVAEKVGVKSASHFSKIFENEVGESPSKFRKSYFDRNHS